MSAHIDGNRSKDPKVEGEHPLVIEPTREHLGTIIALHGMGSNGQGFRSMLEPVLLRNEFVRNHIRWIFPSARVIRVGIAQGNLSAWYNIKSISLFPDEDREGLDESSRRVHQYIEQEIANGVSSERILVCGVSQGGSMALYSTITFRGGRLGGCVCVSGWVPLASSFFWNPRLCSASRKTPIMFCHGKQDKAVRHAFGMASFRFVQIMLRWGRKARFKSYAELDHYSTNDKQMQDIAQFLCEILHAEECMEKKNNKKMKKSQEKAAVDVKLISPCSNE